MKQPNMGQNTDFSHLAPVEADTTPYTSLMLKLPRFEVLGLGFRVQSRLCLRFRIWGGLVFRAP